MSDDNELSKLRYQVEVLTSALAKLIGPHTFIDQWLTVETEPPENEHCMVVYKAKSGSVHVYEAWYGGGRFTIPDRNTVADRILLWCPWPKAPSRTELRVTAKKTKQLANIRRNVKPNPIMLIGKKDRWQP